MTDPNTAPDRIAAIARRFDDGYNCSQITLSAHAARFGMSERTALRLAAPFGGGIARTGQTCGAVTGALMVLGLEFGHWAPGDQESKEKQYRVAQDFLGRFREAHGSTLCRDLLGCDIGTPEGSAQAHQRNLFKETCPRLVAAALDIVEELLRR